MKNKFISTITFGLIVMTSVSMAACVTKECDPEGVNSSESGRAKDGEHGASGHQNTDGQNGQDGQNGVSGQDGGHGGNGGDVD